jgi:hypothetical protein
MPTHVADQIKYGESVYAGITTSKYMPAGDPVVPAFHDALTKLSATETAAQTRAKGTIPARNAARVVFIGAAHAVKARAQALADADPENAEAIITSMNLALKKLTKRQKQEFGAKNGANSGSVEVFAKSAGPRACYEWQYSVDGGKTWTQVANTMQAKTTITGLPVATMVQFRYRVTTKAGMGDWSQPISLLVR